VHAHNKNVTGCVLCCSADDTATITNHNMKGTQTQADQLRYLNTLILRHKPAIASIKQFCGLHEIENNIG
jgi:hypothetical protein